jgi:branched-chain amino acid transport system permease protein
MQSSNRKALLGLTIFLILFPVVAMNVTAIGHYLDIMIFVGIYCLINMGLSLLMGYAGQISLGHAAFFGLGAYTSGILCTKFSMSPWLAMVAGVGITALVAYIVGVPSLSAGGLHCGGAVPEIERTLFGHGNPGFWGYRPHLFQ